MSAKIAIAFLSLSGAVFTIGCASSNKDGLSGPNINMDEPHYDSSIERSKDRPAIEKGAQVDFFKFKQGF